MSPISFKEIDLVVVKQPENPEVFADIFMLKTVIRNLLSNAVKFTPKAGKIEMKYSFLQDGNILLEIKDRITSYNVCYTKLLRWRNGNINNSGNIIFAYFSVNKITNLRI